MADQETKDAIESTALTVVQEQQNIVGGAMVGAAGAGVLAEGSQSQFDILEQIRDLQLRAVRGINEVATKLGQMLSFDKDAERREREDATELAKEQAGDLEPGGEEAGDVEPNPEAEEKIGALAKLSGFLMAIPGVGFVTKLFKPILGFFGKGGFLVKVFGRFGPLGVLITGFLLLKYYADDIAKALAPALDRLKELVPKLQPVIDFFKRVGDFLIKELLDGIGGALELVIKAVDGVVEGFKMIFEGDILGGLNRMFGLEEGLLGFLLDLPKKIFDKTVEFLGGLAEAMGIDFKALYDNIALYVTDTITNIKNFFIDLKDNIVGFFVDAYNTVKTTITDAVQGAFDFIADIFNSISDFMSESFTKAKNFVTQLPDKILGFIANMFSPIIDFFNNIGNRIKMTINGVIDALPLPGFVKDKIKFDVEPSQDQLDEATENSFEKLEAPNVDSPSMDDNMFANIEKHKDAINKFMEETGTRLDLSGTRFHFDKGVPKYRFENSSGESFPILANSFDDGPADEIALVKNYQANKLASSSPNVDVSNIEEIPAADTKPIIIQKGGDTDAASVQQETDIHSGKLDTGIDSYFDRVAFNARGYG